VLPAAPVLAQRLRRHRFNLDQHAAFADLGAELHQDFLDHAGDRGGTSMVALSDSSVAMASSILMVSPTLTNRSITGTSAKSPISGL
jgi:hypothetical protein